MTWLAVKGIGSKVFLWLKAYWQVPFLLLWTMAVYLLTRRNSDAIIDVLNAKKESYDKQIEILKSARTAEIKKREELHLKYKEILGTIEKEFKLKEENLSVVKKKKIKQIIKSSKDSPNEINKKIEDLFGFTRVN